MGKICFLLLLLPFSVLAQQKEVAPKTYLAEIGDVLQREWPKNRTVDIVCHGHSVPAGYFKTPIVRTFDAYPHLLHRALSERFPFAVINVIVTAIGGENSEQGAARFEHDVLSLNPDVITIDYGLNDRNIGLDRAHAAWTSMIEQAQSRGIKIILLTCSPDFRSDWLNPDDPINQHSDQIRLLAETYHTGLVDSDRLFKGTVTRGEDLSAFMSQVNHPNRKGHELISDELLKWFPVWRK
ncbi:SGNH/GDSL hydrolase family protein [candidate division KSB1 bacterium]|nr:SGNH/GDSL hydrolase family protein [candidate division KSB1 bacterium]